MVLSCRRTLCKDTQVFSFFFFNDTATTEIYTLSLHDALPISGGRTARRRQREADYQESESSHACPSLRATAGSNTSAPYIATNLPEIRELFVRLPTIVVGAPGEMEHRIWGPRRVGSGPPMTTRQPTRRPRDVRQPSPAPRGARPLSANRPQPRSLSSMSAWTIRSGRAGLAAGNPPRRRSIHAARSPARWAPATSHTRWSPTIQAAAGAAPRPASA